ncbi:unnamed protein product [Closterium sp. Naga37s-1]|nr:unnamed protein product [Closterium sp. Naga37s-1]
MPPKSAQELQAERLKQKGNEYFNKGFLGAAIDAYTEAITFAPGVPVYWTNRALCHRRKCDWPRVEHDCTKALELDRNSVKARFLLGLALVELSRFPEAVRELEKALEALRNDTRLVRSDNLDDIWRVLASAKYRRWEEEAKARREKQQALGDELRLLLKNRLCQQVSQLLGKEGALNGSARVDFSSLGNTDGLDPHKSEQVRTLVQQYQERLNTLENVFDKAGAPDRPTEVPDFLCCKITMDIFKDPVITPSGVTYERAVLVDHLKLGKHFDPPPTPKIQATTSPLFPFSPQPLLPFCGTLSYPSMPPLSPLPSPLSPLPSSLSPLPSSLSPPPSILSPLPSPLSPLSSPRFPLSSPLPSTVPNSPIPRPASAVSRPILDPADLDGLEKAVRILHLRYRSCLRPLTRGKLPSRTELKEMRLSAQAMGVRAAMMMIDKVPKAMGVRAAMMMIDKVPKVYRPSPFTPSLTGGGPRVAAADHPPDGQRAV